MPTTVLRTRLVPPRLPSGCLARRGLTERVTVGLEGRVVAVIAGPGYGKTTLLVQALEAQRRPWVWCSCDEGLASGAALSAHLVAGLADRLPGFGAGLPSAGTIEDQVTALVNELQATLAEDVVVALDDVHLLPPETAAALAMLTRALPAGVHLLAASRSAAAVPRPRPDPRGLAELGEAELALTESEAGSLVRAAGAELAPAELARLHRITEGWVTGLVLAARPGGAIRLTEGEAFDDLARRALAGQPEAVRSFVLDTAPLERFTPEIARLVTGRADASSICRALVIERLFTARLEGPGEWYRYHQLFAAFLRREVAAHDPVRLETLHRRAAGAWRAAGQPLEAVRHSVESGDWAGAAEELDPIAENLAASPNADVLHAWLRAMPPRYVSDRPSLILARATLLLGHAEHEASFAAFEQAIETLLGRGDHERAAVALFRLLQAMFAAGTRPDRRAEVGARWLARLDPAVRMAPAARVMQAIGCAYARRFEEAAAELEAATGTSDGSQLIPVYAAAVRAHFLRWARDGRPEALEALAEPIEVLERDPSRDQLAFGAWMRLLRGYLLNDLGRHEDALDETARALEAAGRRGLARTPGRMVAWLRSVALAGLERWDELEEELAPPELVPAPHEATSYAYRYRAAAAQLAAARGDHAATTTHIRLGREGMRTFGAVSDDPVFLCDFAIAAHRVGEAELAEELAVDACSAADEIGAEWQRARASLVGAALQRDAPGADALLEEALALSAEPVFETLWTGRERRLAGPLLARALSDGLGPPGLASRLLARCGGEVLSRCAADLESAPSPVRVRLTEAAAEAVAADGEVLDGLLRDRDASVRAAARRSWIRLRERPRAALRIVTLGEFRLWRDQVAVPDAAFGRQKARALFGLLLTWDRAVHRDELCDAFWPGLSPDRAAGALRTTLHDLRRAVHPELDAASPAAVIVADGEAVRIALSERDSLDVDDLNAVAAAVRSGEPVAVPRLEHAVALYRGPLLSEWPYEEWARVRREEAEAAYRGTLAGLASALARDGRHQAAAERWHRLVALDPERESWHRGLMRAYAAGGERALALRQFHACRATLRRRQGIEPGPETRALYSAILREEPLPVPERDVSVTTSG